MNEEIYREIVNLKEGETVSMFSIAVGRTKEDGSVSIKHIIDESYFEYSKSFFEALLPIAVEINSNKNEDIQAYMVNNGLEELLMFDALCRVKNGDYFVKIEAPILSLDFLSDLGSDDKSAILKKLTDLGNGIYKSIDKEVSDFAVFLDEKNFNLFELVFNKGENGFSYDYFIRGINRPITEQKKDIRTLLSNGLIDGIIEELNKPERATTSDNVMVQFYSDCNEILCARIYEMP